MEGGRNMGGYGSGGHGLYRLVAGGASPPVSQSFIGSFR
jgi:hypothetical protein